MNVAERAKITVRGGVRSQRGFGRAGAGEGLFGADVFLGRRLGGIFESMELWIERLRRTLDRSRETVRMQVLSPAEREGEVVFQKGQDR